MVVWSTSEGVYICWGERESNVEDLVVWSTSEGVYICWRERESNVEDLVDMVNK